MEKKINFNDVLDVKKIKVLGYTTDFNQCDCCGRENLKGTVSILDMQTDVVLHFGTGCAASADKYDTLDAVKAVKKEINKVVNEYKDKQHFANMRAWKLLKDVFGQTNGRVNCSESCYQTLATQIFSYALEGNKKIILLEGQEIPKIFRKDLDAAGLCLRLPIPNC